MKFDRDKTKQELDDSDLRKSDARSLRMTGRVLAKRIFDEKVWPVEAPITLRAPASRRFAHELSVRRRFQSADPLGFLSAQFGQRFASVNARLRAGERVYKQPGRFLRNTTFRSITELFMSFKTSQFVQHLRFVLNELRSKDNVPARESARVERVMLSRSSDRRELQSTSLTAVSRSYLSQQPKFRSDYFQAITHGALSQLVLSVRTAPQFKSETFASLFAITKTQLQSESFGNYLTSLQQSIAGPGGSAGTNRQTIVYAMGALSSAHKLMPMLPLQGQVNRQEQMQNVPPGGPERRLASIHWNREFQLVTPGSQLINERSLINLISHHRDRAEQTHVANRLSPAMTFSSFAKSSQSQRFQKTLPRLSLTRVSFVLQPTHERLMRSESRFVQFLRETSLSKHSQISKFISRYRNIETDRRRQEVAERIFARKEAGRPVSSNDFVFAQAHRQEPGDERVAKKVEAREIVEIVRKELKQSMNAATPLWNFTRRDYEEIGDQVYSSLVRRLTVERERLGLT